jgi:DNA-binding transcriptional LysR family regulator
VSCPTWLARQRLADELVEFRRRYPQIVVDMSFEDRAVGLVEEGYDPALRVMREGSLAGGFIALPVRPILFLLAASRDYLKRNGRLESREELAGHHFIVDWQSRFHQFLGPKGAD